jgi:hypothetical protein
MSFLADSFIAGPMTGSALEIVASLAPVQAKPSISSDLPHAIAAAAQTQTEELEAEELLEAAEAELAARCPRPQIPFANWREPVPTLERLDREEASALRNRDEIAPRLPESDRNICLNAAAENLARIGAQRPVVEAYFARREQEAEALGIRALERQANSARHAHAEALEALLAYHVRSVAGPSPSPLANDGNLADLMSRWEQASATARTAVELRLSCAAALKKSGYDPIFSVKFRLYMTDEYEIFAEEEIDQVIEKVRDKYRWKPEIIERFCLNLVQRFENERRGWDEAAETTGYLAADEIADVAVAFTDELEDRIGRAEARSLSDIQAQVRLVRALQWDHKAAPDDQDWQVDILTRISNSLERLGAQAGA